MQCMVQKAGDILPQIQANIKLDKEKLMITPAPVKVNFYETFGEIDTVETDAVVPSQELVSILKRFVSWTVAIITHSEAAEIFGKSRIVQSLEPGFMRFWT